MLSELVTFSRELAAELELEAGLPEELAADLPEELGAELESSRLEQEEPNRVVLE